MKNAVAHTKFLDGQHSFKAFIVSPRRKSSPRSSRYFFGGFLLAQFLVSQFG
jgi:hypothetical protein